MVIRVRGFFRVFCVKCVLPPIFRVLVLSRNRGRSRQSVTLHTGIYKYTGKNSVTRSFGVETRRVTDVLEVWNLES